MIDREKDCPVRQILNRDFNPVRSLCQAVPISNKGILKEAGTAVSRRRRMRENQEMNPKISLITQIQGSLNPGDHD
jgi:hypothetical protein